jgi:hypothetical protein
MVRPHVTIASTAFQLATILMFCITANTRGATREETQFFETHVRPLLAERCFRCHGEDKSSGNLRLDSLAAVLQGGDSGSAVTPGKPADSLLLEAVNYESYEMPPDGKLPEEQITVLSKWVSMGAPWPDSDTDGVAIRVQQEKITDEDRAFWSFQPLHAVTAPDLGPSDGAKNEIDAFVLERLMAEGLTPSPEADRRDLLRRVTFDLTGLPPTPEEMQAFLADPSPTAYEDRVEELLQSPRYGERWASHWLALVRYADSDGYRQDALRPHAWRYRDYVVRAFNDDKPYDRFVMEQLAGDEIAPGDVDALAATSYLRHWIYEYNQRDVRTQWDNILNDITDVTADVFLGMGLSCARCHDHKFDPLLRDDYFRIRAFFAPLLPRDDIPFASSEQLREYHSRLAEWKEKTKEIRVEMDTLAAPHREAAARSATDRFPPDIRDMILKPPAERSPLEHQLAELANRQILDAAAKVNIASKLKGEAKERWQELTAQLAAVKPTKPSAPPPAFTVTDVGLRAPETRIPKDRTKRVIEPGFLTVLEPGIATIAAPAEEFETTGRRTALAQWITRPDHPLTTRVIVNRVWQDHFGRGIVATSSDFGRLGEPPSHPELLDWLAQWFVDHNWSLKELHRLIVTSATYRQTSRRQMPELARARDPENRLLWRGSVRRLEAEQIRDAMLAVTGELDLQLGGPAVDADRPRRSVYVKVRRNRPTELLAAFDAPDGFSSVSQRNITTTPTQSLLMLNGKWTLDRARAFAKRLGDRRGRAAIEHAFLLAYGRVPTIDETDASMAFLDMRTKAHSSTDATAVRSSTAALVDLCHVLLNSNEFIYID